MTASLHLYLAIGFLLLLLTLVSYVEALYTEMARFLSREFQENIDVFEQTVEPRLGVTRARASISMSILAQLSTATIAFLLAADVFADGNWTGGELAQAAVVLVLCVVVCNRLIPFVLFTRTRGEWLGKLIWPLRILVYLALPATLVLGFTRSVATLTHERPAEQPETAAEAVDALIEAGQEEGILQEGDRDLIQSVVEFGDTTVREVMTPRPEVFAVPVTTTVEQFTEMLQQRPYSRVPVYEENIDRIQGVVLAHDVLQVADTEARTRTVRDLMRPAYFVPESQRVSPLLREMQRENVNLAVVIDEYGGVAGVVTIEDLVEEIVGEIRDEHEAAADVVREADGVWLVPGSLDVDRVDQLFGVRLERKEAATVAGLMSEVFGRIPAKGEVIEKDGLRFEVVDATNRKVERLRISALPPGAQSQDPSDEKRLRA